MTTPLISRVFMNGNSQAVRIPQQFRLTGSKVEISRNLDGDLVIHPVAEKRGDALVLALSGFDREFIDLLETGQREQSAPQEREVL
jgi:antitoxin VapB